MSCPGDVRDVLRRLIHSCYAGKIETAECLSSLYKEIDDDENWGGDEEIEDEGELSELDGDGEDEEQSGGFLDAIIGILTDD